MDSIWSMFVGLREIYSAQSGAAVLLPLISPASANGKKGKGAFCNYTLELLSTFQSNFVLFVVFKYPEHSCIKDAIN